jgi:alpha-ribazole phosphatase/probable phosphoglycerate mutase
MKIYFVRHGQSESNKKGVLTGHIDIPLSDEGIEQVKKTSLEISSDFHEIYSSDLIRCKQTAEIINEKLNVSITYDSRLRERNFGSLAGKSWAEVGEELREIDKKQLYDYRPHGGEHVDEVKERVFSCIEEIKIKHPNKKILIVTSGGIIRLLHNVLNGQIHSHIENSSVHEFEFTDN